MQISSIGFSAELKKKSKNFVVSKLSNNVVTKDNSEDIDKGIKIEKEISLDKNSKIEIKESSVHDDVVNVKDFKDVIDITEKIPEFSEQINSQASNIDSNKKSKTISISNLLSKNNDQRKEDITISNVNLNEFSKADLLSNWKEMISILKKNGKSNLAITLGIYDPILLDNFLIEVPLSNSSQIELVFHEKQKILQILRSRLGNDKLDLKTVVVESEKRDVAYTNKDKFNKMLEKNPNLQVLREKLGLDPEY